jgi:three-Cys-motif partner protein
VSDEVCKYGGKKLANGNCEFPADDGLPVQSVGAWARKKHERLRLYLEATWEVRARFVGPGKGGAAFIDLFAGPGRVRVRDASLVEPGSAVIAMEHQAAPFSRLVFCDADADNAQALAERSRADPRVTVFHGDCNERIGEIMRLVPMNGLNLAFFDPFGAKTFHWKTLEALASARRMDLLMHFPTNTVKRNYGNKTNPQFEHVIDQMLGVADWRTRVPGASDAAELIDVLRERLVTLGYVGQEVRTMPVKNDQGGLLYHLVFASKSTTGTKIWNSISTHDGPQRGFRF